MDMIEPITLEKSSADIHLLKNENPLDYQETITLKFAPEFPDLVQAFEETNLGEFIRQSATVIIIDNTCKSQVPLVNNVLVTTRTTFNQLLCMH